MTLSEDAEFIWRQSIAYLAIANRHLSRHPVEDEMRQEVLRIQYLFPFADEDVANALFGLRWLQQRYRAGSLPESHTARSEELSKRVEKTLYLWFSSVQIEIIKMKYFAIDSED